MHLVAGPSGRAAARLLRSWVRIPPGAWMFVCCECCVLSGRDLCGELITRPEESYRMWCVVVCDLETSRMRRPWPALSRSATAKKKCILLVIFTVISVNSKNVASVQNSANGTHKIRLQPRCERDLCFPKMLRSVDMGRDSSVGLATGYGLDGPTIESRLGARFSTPVQTGPVAHPTSCTMDTGSFTGVNSGRGLTLTPHPLLVSLVMKE